MAGGPDNRELYSYLELPIGATATAMPTALRPTGLWRYTRPSIDDRTPPCHEACPVGNWIQRFLAEFGQGRIEDAWWTLKLENPFPGVCGRVCYHPCERGCNREHLDSATGIQAVERALADHFSGHPEQPLVTSSRQDTHTAVVGSGPAGMACAYFLTLLGHDVTVFEAEERLGGIPQLGIPEYRLPRNVLDKEIEDILALGVQVRNRCRVGTDVKFDELLEYDAVFLASGAHRTRLLRLPGEDLEGVFTGLEFLRRHNIDHSIRVGERVLVIGGGNTAIDVVRTVLRLGGQPAILYRRTRNEMPAFCDEVEEALAEGAQLRELLSPVAIRSASSNGLVVECAKMRLEASGTDGRPRPVPIDGEVATFEADQLVMATGEMPDLSYLPSKLELSRGMLPVNRSGQTCIDKVFAGGDVVDQPWTVAQAIGSAKRSAIAIDQFLRGEDIGRGVPTTMREHLGYAEPEDSDVVTVDQLNLAYDRPSPRAVPEELPPAERIADFNEVNTGIGFDAAVAEARRCLSCGVCRMCGNCYLFCPDSAVKLDHESGRYVIDYEYCKGCGICHNECPVASILIAGEGAA